MADPERRFGQPEPNELPPDLADYLKSRPVACLFISTDQGTVMAIKIARQDIESARGIVPFGIRHELLSFPQAPVIRVITTIFDKPSNPLALETFINVEDPQQRADYQALSEQDTHLMLFYDETVTHRLTKEIKNVDADVIRQIVSKADELFAAIPKEKFDFDAAKADVMARIGLSDSAPKQDREPQPLSDRDLRRFRPEITQQLLLLAERLTGIRPVIKRADTLPNDSHGLLKPPEAPVSPGSLSILEARNDLWSILLLIKSAR